MQRPYLRCAGFVRAARPARAAGGGLLRSFALLSATLLAGGSAAAQLCRDWTESVEVGRLDHRLIPEASGLAVSRQFASRLYHHNDRDNAPFLFVTDANGRNAQPIKIEGPPVANIDFEDMTLGPCQAAGTCLFIGDIGDNPVDRQTIEILVIPEKQAYGDSVTPLRIIQLAYPDGPHNAEGLAIHLNGDLYILTKEFDRRRGVPRAARLYRIERERWESGDDQIHTLAALGMIDLPALLGSRASPTRQAVTAIDFSPDGGRLLVLTKQFAIELTLELESVGRMKTEELLEGRDYVITELSPLNQPEAVAYLPDGRSFLYDTESRAKDGPIMKVTCRETAPSAARRATTP